MSQQAAWDLAVAMAPDVYGKVNKQWHSGTRKAPAGAKSRLSPGEITELLAFTHLLLAKGCAFSLDLIHYYVCKRLSPKRVSRSWAYKFLCGAGLAYRKVRGRDRKKFSAAQISGYYKRLQQRLWFLADRDLVHPDRIVNVDESAVELTPSPTHAWTYGDAEALPHLVPYAKLSATVSVCYPMCETTPCITQIIFKGSTPRALPDAATLGPNTILDYSESKW